MRKENKDKAELIGERKYQGIMVENKKEILKMPKRQNPTDLAKE